MNKWVGAAAGLVGGQAAGKVLSVLLSSDRGGQLLERLDRRTLTPLERRVLAQRWAGRMGKALSAAVAALFIVQGGSRFHLLRTGNRMEGRRIDWVQVTQRTAEIMLALGAILKVAGQFLEERQKVAEEHEHAAAKRLT